MDALALAEVHNDRVFLAQTVQEIIQDEVPVSNLVTPFWNVGLSDRMDRNVLASIVDGSDDIWCKDWVFRTVFCSSACFGGIWVALGVLHEKVCHQRNF